MSKKTLFATAVIALVVALSSVSSASAFQWTPPNTAVTATGAGNTVFKTAHGQQWTCTNFAWSAKTAGPEVVGTLGPAITGCSNSFIGGTTAITNSGRWSLTATSTSTATLVADTSPSGGTVMSTSFGGFLGCSPITVKGPLKLTNQAWNNVTHQLTISPATPLTLHTPSGVCTEIFGSTITMSGTIAFPSSVTILP
jgi:hypothetical protein